MEELDHIVGKEAPMYEAEVVDSPTEKYDVSGGRGVYRGSGLARTALLTVAAFALQMFSWGAGDIPSSHQSQNIDTGKATHLVYDGGSSGGNGRPTNDNYSGVRVAFGSEDSGNPYPNGGPGAGDQCGQSGPRDTDINIGSVVAGLFNAIGPGTANAGQGEPLPQDLLPQSVVEYFDGGVYNPRGPDFPRDRWNFGGVLCKDDGDIAPVFDPSNPLYEMIGRHIEEQYRAGQLVGIGFTTRNTREIGITFKIGENYVTGFRSLEPGMMDAIMRYEKP